MGGPQSERRWTLTLADLQLWSPVRPETYRMGLLSGPTSCGTRPDSRKVSWVRAGVRRCLWPCCFLSFGNRRAGERGWPHQGLAPGSNSCLPGLSIGRGSFPQRAKTRSWAAHSHLASLLSGHHALSSSLVTTDQGGPMPLGDLRHGFESLVSTFRATHKDKPPQTVRCRSADPGC